MLRALWFFLKAALLVGAAVWLMEGGGRVNILWRGYEVETAPGFLIAVFLGVLIVWTFLYRLWRAVATMPQGLRRYRGLMRREQGYRAVTQGLLAIAAGDARQAQKQASRAQILIPGTPLTGLLTAQTALIQGRIPEARRAFIDLIEDKQAAFFGLRGLLGETLAARHYDEALTYARRAAELQPKRPWVLRALFDLEAKNRHWTRAHKTLTRGEGLGVFDRKTARRHRQALLLAQTEELEAKKLAGEARRFAAAAFRMDPGFAPAALRLAQAYAAAGKRHAALKTILKAWPLNPHPDLAALWLSLRPPEKKALSIYDAGRGIYDWVLQLHKLAPDHRESQRALGRAAMSARQWREARDCLMRAGDYRALAQLEHVETGNDAKAREWLEMAADHPPEAQWVCQSCAHAAPVWQPLCGHCMAFDALEWMIPMGRDRQVGGMPANLLEDVLRPPAYGASV